MKPKTNIRKSNVKFRLFITICLGLLLVGTEMDAQDPHFSQFHNSPLTLNPAMTGLMNNDLRFVANYRNQWATLGTPFQTISASVDISILNGFLDNDFFGAGLLVVNDRAGDGNLKTTQVHLSAAYSKSISPFGDHYISFGGQFGGVQRSINISNLTFDSQFDGDALNTGIASGENFANDQKYYLDFSAGVAYYFMPNERSSFYIGGAIGHLNEPDVSFFENSQENLFRKYTLHAGGEMSFGPKSTVSFIPRAIILIQGPHREINMGGMLKYLITGDEFTYKALYFGTLHRFNDAQVIITRFDYGPFGIGLSYDLNISSLSRASSGVGGPEVSLIYKTNFFQDAKRKKGGRVVCPSL